ncbi:Tyrosinase [Sphaceloma murrayae]|uniref:tyrosinase n=1 Tax=Sphaceloma murrayae TaxID=2082308 RepID=A0A2K1R0I6_9PEZI|nr:Tyrosinase [Sphaceloma murrayae]
MKFSSIVSGALVAAMAAVPTAAIPSPPLEARQNGGPVVVTGVTGNGVQQRMELRTMQRNNPDMFNVFIIGLRRMMAVPQNNALSYYQIAGIHGRPFIPWDGVTPMNNGPSEGYGGGYCTHVSNIFATWHRPYLALYEQILYGHVQDAANSFPDDGRRARYVNAARNFRIPYWDWAAQSCAECLPYPRLVSQMYLDVDTPNGRQTLMNPLFRYNFTSGPPTEMAANPFATWTWTRRYPSSWDVNNAWSQNDLVAPQIANNQRSFRTRLYNLLTGPSNFDQFSNSAWFADSTGGQTDSLESVHDAIHSFVGTSGHMSYLDFSAFDPIFFLHHAMVDRMWALWTATHPNGAGGTSSYVSERRSSGTTFYYGQGTAIDADFPLAPFHRDTNRNFWTSNQIQQTTTFGYVYPETPQGVSTADVNRAVSQLYGPTTTSGRKRDVVSLSKRDDGHHYHYAANIASQKFQMNGTYRVYIFLGQPSDNPADWPIASNLVGTHGVLSTVPGGGMTNMDVLVTGTIPLTESLTDKCNAGELKDLDPKNVEPYLESNLNWRVAMSDGTAVDNGNVAGLSVSVVTSDVRPPPADTDMPIWGHFSAMPEITANKLGGHMDKLWALADKYSIGELINEGMKSKRFSLKWSS